MCLGVPGQVIEVLDPANHLVSVEMGGVRRPVNVACVLTEERPIEDCVGDWVLVHVGFALERLDEDEAQETLALLAQLEVVDEVPV
ncbi:MAG: HypC/HybG/HupF family hydrogenase formation chaperone [Cyanophyceae cyanobacterium]